MGAGIPADRTGSNDGYLPAHAFPLTFLAAEDSAPGDLTTTGAAANTVAAYWSGIFTTLISMAEK
jgi:hypothetical protein